MLLGARQFFERRGAPTPPLPYDAEVEYLESTSGGGEYIDTGFSFSTDYSVPQGVYFECTYQTYDRNGRAFGIYSRYAVNNWYVLCGDFANTKPELQFGVNVSSAYGAIGSPTSAAKSVRVDMSGVYVEGVHYPFSYPTHLYFPVSSLMLFADWSRSWRCRIYAFSAQGAGVEIKLVPVRFTNEQNQSEGAMYDRVSGQLFRNAGTGAFVIGPDKS